MTIQNASKMKEMERSIEKLLFEAIELADIGGIRVPTRAVAERLYDSEPEMMRELQRPWMVDRLIWMISRKRRARRSVHYDQAQMALPGFEGLPKAIFLPSGQRMPMDNATVSNVRDHVKMLRVRLKAASRVALFEAVIELMQKHNTPMITWSEVKRLEMAKLDA